MGNLTGVLLPRALITRSVPEVAAPVTIGAEEGLREAFARFVGAGRGLPEEVEIGEAREAPHSSLVLVDLRVRAREVIRRERRLTAMILQGRSPP